MRNVTLTLEEAVLEQARIEAAKEGKSLSRFVADVLERRVGRKKTQAEIVASWLAGPVLFEDGEPGRLPSREELYDDAILSRRERADLCPGLSGAGEAGESGEVDLGARRPRTRGR
jgi:hypothetical protein